MRKLVMTLVLTFISIASNANSRWIFVVESSSNDIYFIDHNSFQRNGDSVTFWFRENLNERTKSGVLSSKIQKTINCKRQEIIGRYYIFYDDVDNYGRITSSSVAIEPVWEPIPPDTVNWKLFEVVCKK